MIKTLLVEDETQSRDFIKKLIADTAPFIEVVGETGSVDEAIQLIRETQPQLVILDIQLYGRSAFDIFKEIGEFDFQLLFITAFEHFAIPAIKLSAVDYLLKPLSPAEFKIAMDKVYSRANLYSSSATVALQKENLQINDKLLISDYKEIYLVEYDAVVYFEGDGNYTHVILNTGKKITSAKPIYEYEEQLATKGFYRVHKSYLINMTHITKYIKGRGGEVVMVNGDTVYVSSRKKNEFLEMIKNRKVS